MISVRTCENGYEDGIFRAQDGSDYRLVVNGFGTAAHEMVMFDGSGLSYHFSSTALKLPMLPNSCQGFGLPEDHDDRVFYVTKIGSYNRKASIEIEYHNEGGEFEFYYGHLIKKITAPFGRTLEFWYSDVVIPMNEEYSIKFPQLESIIMPGFQGSTIEYTFEHLNNPVTIYEPWGEADCRIDSDSFVEYDVHLTNQIILTGIQLPEPGYRHGFDYGIAGPNTGEIERYRDPLGTSTEYAYKNVFHVSGIWEHSSTNTDDGS